MNRTDAICLGIIILVIVGIISAVVYSMYSDSQTKGKSKATGDLLVQEGDLITCHFTEYVYTKDANGTFGYLIYQTTDEEVANDDLIPKSITFSEILKNNTGAPIPRQQLTAIVGIDLSTEVNPGFNQLVIGMSEGETKKGEVSVQMGYGERNLSYIQTIPLFDKIPLYDTVDREEFEKQYPKEVEFEPGKTFEHHYWGWTIRIESVATDSVTFRHEPEIGMELDIFEWPTIVENISSSTSLIWLRHKPSADLVNTPIDAEVLEFYNPTFTEIKEDIYANQQPYPGIITSIHNQITVDFNRENIGKNLKYEITIIKIERD